MNSREHLVKCFKDEKPKFLRVLRAVPPEQLAYRPHPRSTCTGDLVWLLASVNFVQTPAPKTLEESIAAYERNSSELEKRLARLDDAAWEKKARFLVNGNVAWESPLGEMLWGFLFDAIHHRGQLSSYLRPMGGKVPSIYGPSADDAGM